MKVYNYNDEWLKDLNGMFIPRNFVRVLHSPASTAQPSTTTEIYSKQIKNAISSENNNGVIIQANNLSIGIGYGVLLSRGFCYTSHVAFSIH